jgi:hypothetical protein
MAITSARGSISGTHTTPERVRRRSSIRLSTSALISGVSGAPASRTIWTAHGPQEVGQTLLAGDAPDEDHARAVRVHPVAADRVLVSGSLPQLGVDAVVDDLDLVRVDVGVAAQDVLAHAVAHRDNGVRGLIGGALDPRGQAVSPTQLLGLPWPHRLQAVRGDDVGYAVEQCGGVAGEVGVPGVRVHEV